MAIRNKKTIIGRIRQALPKNTGETASKARRRIIRIAGLIFGLSLLYSMIAGETGFIRIAKMHLAKERIQKQNHELLVKLVDSEMTLKRLQQDPQYIEYIARTRHFMSRPGEIIYRFK